jgi:hypothetical protein
MCDVLVIRESKFGTLRDIEKRTRNRVCCLGGMPGDSPQTSGSPSTCFDGSVDGTSVGSGSRRQSRRRALPGAVWFSEPVDGNSPALNSLPRRALSWDDETVIRTDGAVFRTPAKRDRACADVNTEAELKTSQFTLFHTVSSSQPYPPWRGFRMRQWRTVFTKHFVASNDEGTGC